MKIILEFYAGKNRIDAWLVDTKHLNGKPPVLKVHLYSAPPTSSSPCITRPKPI